jgi:hypothetical protein
MAIEPTPPPPDHQKRPCVGRFTDTDRQPIEQHFPRGECGQREGGRFSEADPGGLAADDTLIDDLEFGVTSGAVQRAGVIDLVAWGKTRSLRCPQLRRFQPRPNREP